MSTVDYLEKDYNEVSDVLRSTNKAYYGMYPVVSAALDQRGLLHFTNAQIRVLRFLVTRTYLYNRRAECITAKHFAKGVVSRRTGEVVCCGCGMSESTWRPALRSLQDMKIVTAHRFVQEGNESHPRVYEIHFEVLVSMFLPYMNEASYLEKINQLIEVDRLAKAKIPHLQKQKRVPYRISTQKIYKIQGTKSSLREETPASPSHTSTEETDVKKNSKIATDCKSPDELLAEIKSNTATRREQRASSAKVLTEKKWATKDLQALLDKAVLSANETGLKVPRVIAAARGAGVLHKRLLAAGITDVQPFFDWVMLNWFTVANANRRSKAIQMERTGKIDTPMLAAPNFNDLAYRCPYLLALYNDAQARGFQEDREKQDKQAKVQATEQARAAARTARLAEVAKRDAEADARRRTRRVPVAVPGDCEIPTWEEIQERKEHGQRGKTPPPTDDCEVPTWEEIQERKARQAAPRVRRGA